MTISQNNNVNLFAIRLSANETREYLRLGDVWKEEVYTQDGSEYSIVPSEEHIHNDALEAHLKNLARANKGEIAITYVEDEDGEDITDLFTF